MLRIPAGHTITIVQSTAALYAAIIALVILFQICLIAGAPWGRFTQGGRYAGPLPSSGRFVAAVRLRAVEAPVDLIDQLGGWSMQSVGQGYGDGYPLTVLQQWMLKLEQI